MKLSRIVMLSVVALAALAQATFVGAQDSTKKARVLMVTQSKEFTHGPVKRKGEELALSEVAITQLGMTTGLFTVHCTQNAAVQFASIRPNVFKAENTGAVADTLPPLTLA